MYEPIGAFSKTVCPMIVLLETRMLVCKKIEKRAVNAVCSLLLVFAHCTDASEHRHQESIQCRQSECSSGKTLNLSGRKTLTCSAIATDVTPWSRSNETTAPHPESLAAHWYIHEGRLALNTSWKQKRSDLESGKIKGYFLEYKNGLRIKVDLSIDESNKTPEEKESKTAYVRFDYLCAGRYGFYIRPKNEINIRVRSLPLYQSDNAPQPLSTTVDIPSCFVEKSFLNLKDVQEPGCKEYWEKIQKLSTLPQQTSAPTLTAGKDHTIYYLLVCVVGAFLVIVILLKMVYNADANIRYQGCRKIIMISSLQDNCDQVHEMVTKLRDNYRLDITCNWENQTDLGEGAFYWYSEKMEEMNMIVFAISLKIFETRFSSQSQRRLMYPDIEQALNAAEALRLKKTVSVVFLVIGDMNVFRSFWLRQTFRQTVYETSHTFWRFMRQITGLKVSNKMNLRTLLDTGRSETTSIEDERIPLNQVVGSATCRTVETKRTQNQGPNATESLHAGSNVSLYDNVDSTQKIEVVVDADKYQREGARPKYT